MFITIHSKLEFITELQETHTSIECFDAFQSHIRRNDGQVEKLLPFYFLLGESDK